MSIYSRIAWITLISSIWTSYKRFQNMNSFSKCFSVLQKYKWSSVWNLIPSKYLRDILSKGISLADNVHMWVSWDVSRCRQSLYGAVQSETHVASSCFWSQQKLDSPEALSFAFTLQEGGAFFASERTISGQFGSNNSWLCREPHPALINLCNIWLDCLALVIEGGSGCEGT